MNKLTTAIITFCLIIGFTSQAIASPSNKAVFQLGSDKYMINNQVYTMDTISFINNNRVFVPVRYLAYACGLNDKDIKWDNNTKTVSLDMKEKNLSLKIGNNQLVSNNQVIKIMDVAPILICDRTYLPARWVSEFFNYSVEWDPQTKTVLIFPAGETRPQPPEPLNILLVNKIYGLPESFQPGTLVDFDGYQVSQSLQEPLQKLFDSAEEDGISLTVTSGYRSYLRQKQIMDERIEEFGLQEALAAVAPPGHSEHQTGLCVDLGGDSDEAYIWLEANCWRYGFILRYPRGKEEITGYSYEPWHFRFLGVPIAEFMHENNVLTMEEFVSSYLGK